MDFVVIQVLGFLDRFLMGEQFFRALSGRQPATGGKLRQWRAVGSAQMIKYGSAGVDEARIHQPAVKGEDFVAI
jgi:hypothetical protein